MIGRDGNHVRPEMLLWSGNCKIVVGCQPLICAGALTRLIRSRRTSRAKLTLPDEIVLIGPADTLAVFAVEALGFMCRCLGIHLQAAALHPCFTIIGGPLSQHGFIAGRSFHLFDNQTHTARNAEEK